MKLWRAMSINILKRKEQYTQAVHMEEEEEKTEYLKYILKMSS